MSSMCTLDLSYAWLSRLSAYVHIVYVLCMRVHAIRTTLFFFILLFIREPSVFPLSWQYIHIHTRTGYTFVNLAHDEIESARNCVRPFCIFRWCCLICCCCCLLCAILLMAWLWCANKYAFYASHCIFFSSIIYLKIRNFFFGSASVNGISAAYNSQWMDASLAK